MKKEIILHKKYEPVGECGVLMVYYVSDKERPVICTEVVEKLLGAYDFEICKLIMSTWAFKGSKLAYFKGDQKVSLADKKLEKFLLGDYTYLAIYLALQNYVLELRPLFPGKIYMKLEGVE